MNPSLPDRLKKVTEDLRRVSDQSIAKSDELTVMNRRFAQAQHQPHFGEAGTSLGHRDFYNQRRTPREVFYSLGEMLNNYHSVRYVYKKPDILFLIYPFQI